jgi:multidrug resistance efflux pump
MVYNIDDEVVPERLDLPSKNTTFQVIKIVQRICVKFVPRFV